LWYAHTANSKYLRFCHIFVTGIITSTKGSCPLSGKKVFAIGQAIDINKFPKLTTIDRLNVSSIRAVTVGRVDPSKRVEQLLAFVCKSEFNHHFSHFQIIGQASVGNETYEEKLKSLYGEEISSRKIEFTGALPREDISHLFDQADLFIHAFQGSLDKTLVEAIISGLPVITTNEECQKEFGNWSNNSTNSATLHEEFESFIKTPKAEISKLCDRRRKLALDNHSLDQWLLKLRVILEEI
jgi:glycosyltransferase involved in cell wall biosynthesis